MDCNKYSEVCQSQFTELHAKLDRLDEAIRGNGKPGIQLRLDRLETSEHSRRKLIWLIVGCLVTLTINGLWSRVFGG